MKTLFQKIRKVLSFKSKKEDNTNLSQKDDAPEINSIWWGEYVIGEEPTRYFKVADIVICIDQFNKEWRVTSYKNSHFDPHKPIKNKQLPFKSFAAFGSKKISLKPILPDRPLLAELEQPFFIPSKESLYFYVSIPLCIKLEANDPYMFLDEIPTEFLSDTWCGRNTLEGDLCYAGKIDHASKFEDIPYKMTRVLCPVSLVNRSKEPLAIKQFKIPLPFLSIFTDSHNRLWSETFKMIHVVQDEPPEIIVGTAPPKFIQGVKILSPSRMNTKRGLRYFFNPTSWK